MKSLAIKYRPKSFEDVIEQGAIRQILQEQLKTASTKNTYLFTGGAGTGKTTCARIFAKEINQNLGNAIEVDAASNNGVENVREIIEDARFKSLDSDYKVYIIDECHMLSTGAWNAMLKLIEEPPAQTIFIFCTTDPQKIPTTILSRVQRYDFQRISHDSIVDRLAWILEEEKASGEALTYDPEALQYIAKIADGGMRDAITLLDKCISFNPEVNLPNVIEALGTVDYQTMFRLTNAILDAHSGIVIEIIEEIHRSGSELKQFIKLYLTFLLDLCKFSLTNSFKYMQIPATYEPEFDNFSKQDYNTIKGLLARIIELGTNIKWESNPRSLIEATLILFIEEGIIDG